MASGMTEELPAYVRELISEVERRTGYPLVGREQPHIGYDSETRIARRDRPQHEAVWVPAYRDFEVHFLTSSAWKALRIWAVPEEERYLPATDVGQGLPAEDYEEFRERHPGVPKKKLRQMSEFLYRGIVRQLTSMPMDLRVERELAEALPEHRDRQRAYLARQVRAAHPR